MERNWPPRRIPRLDGKLAIVTGANSGIGYSTALELARAGAHVLLGCRDANPGIAARHRLLTEVPKANVALEALDLASLTSIRRFAERMLGAGTPVDILVNNAGVMNIPTRELTEDGFERQFGTNHRTVLPTST
ncbi:SDR family NAD(P)-dependent oxidoreductase [Pendulispora rubella]|uniref:SDR family NAD(P)-dependent oxidoreductase n=1 Tax=Pendulispora rubella TaxID=2741070 RepID=A0ABZ2KWP4_9BACT